MLRQPALLDGVVLQAEEEDESSDDDAMPGGEAGGGDRSICGRCFGSYQALGGHVLGHKKKAKSAAIAVAARDETTTTVSVAPVRQRQNSIIDSNGQGGRGCYGDGSRDDEEKPVVDDVAACHDGLDESRAHGKAETASAIDAPAEADHKVAHGDGEEND
ncbi:hypothetical protein E2562_020272 [Oryza meyeriana var. granulata]|uniref:C2H2-type domain-containing protein n=1 Tax=Oryza meyeriana var. granulata TaxID=110450 RepID=A0A6G1DL56_9ORYZ|nr:hypothetical protein E2562_020272 [Oryza meyeriana var. granulata]